jgi:hypothetical protein
MNREAAQQRVEADEAWQTSELRSLTPVFDGHEHERKMPVDSLSVLDA